MINHGQNYMYKLRGYLRLMRPMNCTMMGFAVVVGAALANPSYLANVWQNLVFGFITGFVLTAASMAINDYYDQEIDVVNEPNRPIPSGLIRPKEALAFAFALGATGFVAASANTYLTNSLFCFVIATIAWIVSVTYTTVGKRNGLTGNFLVAACVAVPFIYGSVAVVGAIESNVLIFVLMVFLSITGREITKGIVDVQGDKLQDVKTLAVRFGEKTAALVAALFYLSSVSLSPIPWFLNLVNPWFIPIVVITDLGLVISSCILLGSVSRERAKKVKNMVLFWFVFGLLAFIVGALKV